MEKSESFIPAKSEHFGMRLPDMMGEADEKVSGDMGMDDRVRVMNGFDTQETFWWHCVTHNKIKKSRSVNLIRKMQSDFKDGK